MLEGVQGGGCGVGLGMLAEPRLGGSRSVGILLLPYFPCPGAGEENWGAHGAGLTWFGSPGPHWGLSQKQCSGAGCVYVGQGG